MKDFYRIFLADEKLIFCQSLAEADETDYDLYLGIFINDEQGIINKLMKMVNSELHFQKK